MSRAAGELHDVLITGLGTDVASPRWVTSYGGLNVRVVPEARLEDLRSLPLLTVVRARRPRTLLDHRGFIELLAKKWRSSSDASVLLLEFRDPEAGSPEHMEEYARILQAFPDNARIELVLGPRQGGEALVEAIAKVVARERATAAQQQDPLSRARRVLVAAEDLRSSSGRLAAHRVAHAFGIRMAVLARILGVRRQTLSKTPDAESRQGDLYPFERIARLRAVLPDDEFRRWLRTPNRELEGSTPLQWILDGRAEDVADLVEDMLTGTAA